MSTEMGCEYDPAVQALYVTLRQGKVVRTVELDCPGLMVQVDVDADGHALGVEVLGPQKWDALSLMQPVTVGASSMRIDVSEWRRA